MKAPSEKHLENYLWAHPEAFGEYALTDNNEPVPHLIPKWRQVEVASGKVDLVGTYFDLGLAIIELKKGPIDSKAFAQLMRYMRNFRDMVHKMVHEYSSYQLPLCEYLSHDPSELDWWQGELLIGVLVGSSIEDKNLLIACEACNISVFTYSYEDGQYYLEEDNTAARDRTFPGWTENTPGDLVQSITAHIHSHLQLKKDHLSEITPFDLVEYAQDYLNSLDGES